MKWLDVMLGEIDAKRDAEERRRERRAAILRKAESVLADIVQPAAESAVARAAEAGVLLEKAMLPGGEDALWHLVLRPTQAESFEPAAPFWECIADAYNPALVMRRQLPGETRPRRSAFIRLDEVERTGMDTELDNFICRMKS